MTLDLSRAFQQGFRGGAGAEYLAVASLVRTIGANMPEVKRVLLISGGMPIATLGGHLALDRPIDVGGDALGPRMPATHDPRPIGVFDSGLGGLTSVRELFRVLPKRVDHLLRRHRAPAVRQQVARRRSRGSASRSPRFSCARTSSVCWWRATPLPRTRSTPLTARLEIPVIGVIEPAARGAVEREPARAHRRDRHAGHGGQRRPYAVAVERRVPGTQVTGAGLPAVRAADRGGLARPPVTRLVAEEYLAELRAARPREPDPRLHPLSAGGAADPRPDGPDGGADRFRRRGGARRGDPARRARAARAAGSRTITSTSATSRGTSRAIARVVPRRASCRPPPSSTRPICRGSSARPVVSARGHDPTATARFASAPDSADPELRRGPTAVARAQLRPLKIERGVLPVRPRARRWCRWGARACCAPPRSRIALPQWLRGQGKGWVTAEYGMLPRATGERTPRTRADRRPRAGDPAPDRPVAARGRRPHRVRRAHDHRSTATCSRPTAAPAPPRSTARWCALHDAFVTLSNRGHLARPPLRDAVAAMSVGIVEGHAVSRSRLRRGLDRRTST